MYSIEEFDKQKAKICNYIMYKKRTEYEVKKKFENTIENNMLEDIIQYLKEAGYIDDGKYIQRAIDEYMAIKTLSLKEIKYKLYSKGISKQIIEDYIYINKEVLLEYEKKSAIKIINKKEKSLERDEIKSYLIKKGYTQEIIEQAMEE